MWKWTQMLALPQTTGSHPPLRVQSLCQISLGLHKIYRRKAAKLIRKDAVVLNSRRQMSVALTFGSPLPTGLWPSCGQELNLPNTPHLSHAPQNLSRPSWTLLKDHCPHGPAFTFWHLAHNRNQCNLRESLTFWFKMSTLSKIDLHDRLPFIFLISFLTVSNYLMLAFMYYLCVIYLPHINSIATVILSRAYKLQIPVDWTRIVLFLTVLNISIEAFKI